MASETLEVEIVELVFAMILGESSDTKRPLLLSCLTLKVSKGKIFALDYLDSLGWQTRLVLFSLFYGDIRPVGVG